MNDHQVECFLAAADENNFTKAAERLYISQPAISKVITSLEKELDTKLFLRHSNKKIELTSSGQLYRDFFRKVATEFAGIKLEVDEKSVENALNIRLAYAARWSISKQLFQVSTCLQRRHERVSIDIECLEFQQLVDDLMRDNIDVALSFQDYFTFVKNVEVEPIAKVERVILYSDLYVLRHGPVTSPADLADATFFLSERERDRHVNEMIHRYCLPYGFVPHFRYMRNWDSVVAAVEAGHGVVIFDAWAQYIKMRQFHYLSLGSSHTVVAAWKKNLPEDIMTDMVDTLKSSLALPQA